MTDNDGRDNCNGQITSTTETTGTFRVKSGMAHMLKGGVIMDVVDTEQARVAESWPWREYRLTSVLRAGSLILATPT